MQEIKGCWGGDAPLCAVQVVSKGCRATMLFCREQDVGSRAQGAVLSSLGCGISRGAGDSVLLCAVQVVSRERCSTLLRGKENLGRYSAGFELARKAGEEVQLRQLTHPL